MLRKFLASAALIVATAAPACAAPPLSPELRAINDGQRALVAQTCDRVMGLQDGGVFRQECMDSLASSLAAKTERSALAASYRFCSGRGLSEGSAAFSTCMLDNRDRLGAAAPEPVKLSYDANAQGYFAIGNGDRWRREQYACAQIGLTPGTAAFGQCVAGLDASLFHTF